MDTLQEVLHAYSIRPFYIEKQTERLYMVQDYNQQYALKHSRLTEETIVMWEQVYKLAYEEYLFPILPVYLTKLGKLYEKKGELIYYVTPWKESRETELDQSTIDKIFQSFGLIHMKTKRRHLVEVQQFKQAFQQYKQHCLTLQQQLLTFVEEYEQHRFMSPFELLVCTQFKDVNYSLNETIRRIDQLLEEQEETWYYSLCHKNIKTSHTLVDQGQLYFINWENAGFDYPIFDLVAFFQEETKHYDTPTNMLLRGFDKYMNENELTKKELYLLVIQLLDPQAYLSCVKNHKQANTSMMKQIIHLQHTFRRILFGLHLSAHVEKNV
ncbi:hypothetical protein CAI16_10975 [Virgibacillus dokdonensis]|uniref:Spore coat protein YsxE n=1 Tax=Virgibacillus dokdonensis TaxID=302167 RepID=A0A3E0WQ64_9BACI|nr:phosphotransferase [Virgibacillus dokdonensis]RFA34549.1 hypothetical protein CAI16_10975 [Virgibacillus dokdonensis]